MALLAIEGFDDGLAALRYPTSPGAVDAAYGKNGKGMRVGDNYSAQLVVERSSDLTQTMGGWIYINVDNTAVGSNYLCGFSNSSSLISGHHVAVQRDITNNRWAVHDRTGYTYGPSGGALGATWYYVELQAYIHNTAGWWELRIDGAYVMSATSRDTFYNVGGPIALWGAQATGDVEEMWIDDIYLLDSTGTTNNDFLGICKVETDLPSGNGNSSVLVGSDADSTDNYLLVDNNASVPPATTEYVESDTEGDKDTYAMSDLDGTATVYGVQTTLYAAKDDSGAKFVRPVIRSNGTDYPGTSSPLSLATFIPVDEIWEVDPATSSAWAYTAVNAAQVGPEVRDS